MPSEPRAFRVIQLGALRPNGVQTNEPVVDFEHLVTHHPKANRRIHMEDGQIAGAEDQQPDYRGGDRAYAYVGGEFQEVIDHTIDRYGSLRQDQVLVVKDFILEDRETNVDVRSVGVPSPTSGYVSLIRDGGGMVEISDRPGGDVIARIRHLNPISVHQGDTVAYGQSLGTQNRQGLGRDVGIHVHIEMDTGYYQQCENYIDDLVSGRLPVQAEHRQNVQPLPVVDDGTFRLGESDPRIADLQRVMVREGYRAAQNRPLDQDGVYRPSMQGALLDFQRAHGLSQTGDIDPATLRFAPSLDAQLGLPPVDRELPGLRGVPAQMRPPGPTAPGHPDHPDHRPGLPDPLPAPVNQRTQVDDAFARLCQAARNPDEQTSREQMRGVVQEYRCTPQGQQFQQDVASYGQQREAQERQIALEAQMQQMQEQQQQQHRPHVMRM